LGYWSPPPLPPSSIFHFLDDSSFFLSIAV
jgi:hypothetical protein